MPRPFEQLTMDNHRPAGTASRETHLPVHGRICPAMSCHDLPLRERQVSAQSPVEIGIAESIQFIDEQGTRDTATHGDVASESSAIRPPPNRN